VLLVELLNPLNIKVCQPRIILIGIYRYITSNQESLQGAYANIILFASWLQ